MAAASPSSASIRPGPWGEEFNDTRKEASRSFDITVTGFADEDVYRDYLAAADVAVQLRQQTRGETSAAVLDCMAAGLPTIVNSHGTFAELADAAVYKLPEIFTIEALAAAIDHLCSNPDRRVALGEAAREEMIRHHHPAIVGRAVHQAITAFSTETASGRQSTLIKAIGSLYAPASPSDADLSGLAQTIAGSKARLGHRRIFYDITLLAQSDVHTGIERVVRSFLNQLIKQMPAGYAVEPVRFADGQLRYARAYISEKFEIAADVLPDAPIDYDAGDIYLTLEWAADVLPQMTAYLAAFKRRGGKVVIGIHDLLPMQIPHRFPTFIPAVAERWFQAVLASADQIICVSRCVADDVLRFGNALASPKRAPIKVDYFHIGADIEASLPTSGMPDEAETLLNSLPESRTFIIVGTLEPRKGHQQVLDAFDLLWRRKVDVTLVIVGRLGWSMEKAARSIENSHESGKRLHWIRNASDEYLERLYAASTALIAASEGEGFGLPLIEAAARGLPMVVRDLPVFHEVAGDHAYYFAGETGADLADAISAWLALYDAGDAPASTGLKVARWSESVARFQAAMFGDEPYGLIQGRSIDRSK